jgi:hypothetical protein
MQTMISRYRRSAISLLAIPFVPLVVISDALAQSDPLPSWKEGEVKSAITDFVAKVTQPGGADFVAPEERIAVFDYDGTFWSELPVYFQLAFALDRIKAMTPQHSKWKDTEPFKSVLAGDLKGLAVAGEKGMAEIVAATHAGITTEEFSVIVKDWFAALMPSANGPMTASRISVSSTKAPRSAGRSST